FDLQNVYPPNLVDNAKGDVASLGQFEEGTSANGLVYSSLIRWIALPSFTVQDGQSTMVAAALNLVSKTSDLAFDWKASQFDAIKQAINPVAGHSSGGLSVLLYLGSGSYAQGFFPTLLSIQGSGADVQDDIPYANPFPIEWSETVSGLDLFVVPKQV